MDRYALYFPLPAQSGDKLKLSSQIVWKSSPLTTAGLVTAVLTVINTIAPSILLQNAGAAVALVSDCRAGCF